MEGQNFFAYSDENGGIKGLSQYYTCILKITSKRVFYEFIMGNKHEVLGFKVKLRGSGGGAFSFCKFTCFL